MARRFWMIALVTPVLYLLICAGVDRIWFSGRARAGFWPMSDSAYELIVGILAALSIVAVAAVYLLKKTWVEEPLKGRRSEEGAEKGGGVFEFLGGPVARRFMVLFMICDTVALVGLVMFLIQGRIRAMLLFGVIGLVGYAAAHPKGGGEAG